MITIWLHTRACKYNLSALLTYFESEGVKCTYLTITNSNQGNVTWLHIRACKYNLSALGTYLEGEGVKCTYLDFT